MSIPTNRFVNPYSFVPLPRTVRADREAPTWHDGRNAATVYSGTIGVEWTLRTPLLLPANALEEGWRKKSHIRIPGSSLAGAVRSLHETMFNGCMRVLDDTFVPAYREAAHSYPDLTLAIVSKADENGVPQELMLCRDPVWVDSLELLRHWPKDGELPTTGDLLRFRAAVVKVPGLNRKEIVNVGRVDVLSRAAKDTLPSDENMALGARVLIVSSTSARKKTKKNGQPARALWATAKPTGVRVPSTRAQGRPSRPFALPWLTPTIAAASRRRPTPPGSHRPPTAPSPGRGRTAGRSPSAAVRTPRDACSPAMWSGCAQTTATPHESPGDQARLDLAPPR